MVYENTNAKSIHFRLGAFLISTMEDVPIVSDERALQFIFTQIVVNAVKYSNENIDSVISLKNWF